MHYIEFYFCQQSEFGDRADSSIGQSSVKAIFRWQAWLAYESTFTVMDLRQWILYRELPANFKTKWNF